MRTHHDVYTSLSSIALPSFSPRYRIEQPHRNLHSNHIACLFRKDKPHGVFHIYRPLSLFTSLFFSALRNRLAVIRFCEFGCRFAIRFGGAQKVYLLLLFITSILRIRLLKFTKIFAFLNMSFIGENYPKNLPSVKMIEFPPALRAPQVLLRFGVFVLPDESWFSGTGTILCFSTSSGHFFQ